MNTEETIEFARNRSEPIWHWGVRLNKEEFENYAKENNLTLQWNEPIRPGDL